MTADDILRSYATARCHMSGATWSALLTLATAPDHWHTRVEMLAKMPWLRSRSKNTTHWQAMMIPAIDLGAVQLRQGRRGRGADGCTIPNRYRVTAHGLQLLGL